MSLRHVLTTFGMYVWILQIVLARPRLLDSYSFGLLDTIELGGSATSLDLMVVAPFMSKLGADL